MKIHIKIKLEFAGLIGQIPNEKKDWNLTEQFGQNLITFGCNGEMSITEYPDSGKTCLADEMRHSLGHAVVNPYGERIADSGIEPRWSQL